jgi:hypothetical protein
MEAPNTQTVYAKWLFAYPFEERSDEESYIKPKNETLRCAQGDTILICVQTLIKEPPTQTSSHGTPRLPDVGYLPNAYTLHTFT